MTKEEKIVKAWKQGHSMDYLIKLYLNIPEGKRAIICERGNKMMAQQEVEKILLKNYNKGE